MIRAPVLHRVALSRRVRGFGTSRRLATASLLPAADAGAAASVLAAAPGTQHLDHAIAGRRLRAFRKPTATGPVACVLVAEKTGRAHSVSAREARLVIAGDGLGSRLAVLVPAFGATRRRIALFGAARVVCAARRVAAGSAAAGGQHQQDPQCQDQKAQCAGTGETAKKRDHNDATYTSPGCRVTSDS